MKIPKNKLLRTSKAAKELGLKFDTFVKRNYKPALEVDGVRYYDIEKLKATPFIDGRKK